MAYNKSDLVSKIAQKSNLTKAQAEAAVNAFQDVFVENQSRSGEAWLNRHSPPSASSAQPAPAATRAPAKSSRFRQPTGVRISALLLKKAVTK